MPRVVHFEIHADQPERAAGFYRSVFGWEIQKWGPQDYWLITTGPEGVPGINGGLMRRDQAVSVGGMNGYVCTVDVSSIDEFVAKVTENNGKLITPKHAIPRVGWLAYCQDTEGNTFGLMQADESAI